jgi:hypothetical protein
MSLDHGSRRQADSDRQEPVICSCAEIPIDDHSKPGLQRSRTTALKVGKHGERQHPGRPRANNLGGTRIAVLEANKPGQGGILRRRQRKASRPLADRRPQRGLEGFALSRRHASSGAGLAGFGLPGAYHMRGKGRPAD